MRSGARIIAAALAALGAYAWVGAAEAGPLLDKAVAYSDRWQTHHSPERGCRVEILYADDAHTTVALYDDLGDSTIWTGNYVAAESYRYAVTGNPVAKEYGLRAVRCLLDMEKVTGKPGFIARFVGPYEGPFAAYVGACTGDCHVVSGGEFDGDFWIGNTSSDQYLGWWYGLSHAYDYLLDAPEDEALREEIRGAVGRVLDTLIADDYLITDPDGTVSTAGPEIIGSETLAFHLVAAHIAGGKYTDMLPQVYLDNFVPYFFLTWLPITRWYQYYAFHLGHMSQHMLMRHETFWPLLKFHRNQHRIRYYYEIQNTQQVMFDFIAWGEQTVAFTPAQLAADKHALDAFPPPPKLRIQPVQGPWEPDPVIEDLNELGPIIAGLLGEEWDPLPQQAKDPFPVEERCATGFRWQTRPYEICGGSNPNFEFPAEDYLVAYWMGRFYGLLSAAD